MAPTSHGRGGPQGRESLAHASLAHGPPPSTLAAQLVENMSPSVRFSRPDETAELKKFFAIIENVSNRPAALASHADRVEHNHMLIYVYARVVLEGPKWDDPFADRAHLRTEALRAINFIKVTVRETPEVLMVTSPGTAFIFRGEEPLWLWILPKVLKMLGHPQCLDVTAAAQGLFRELYLVICQHGFLWPVASQLRLYMRSNFNAIHGLLKEIACPSPHKDTITRLRLPLDSYLESAAAGIDLDFLQRQCTYSVATVSHALRHASGMLAIMSEFFALPMPTCDNIPADESASWLLDGFLRMLEIQERWHGVGASCLPALLQSSLQLSSALRSSVYHDDALKHKSFCVLIPLCTTLLARFDRLLANGIEREPTLRLLGSAFLSIARECLNHKPLARLSMSQLVSAIDHSPEQSGIFADDSDLGRCFALLQQAASDPKPASFSDSLRPGNFTDLEIRRQVRDLDLQFKERGSIEPPSKRRRTSGEPRFLPLVLNSLYRVLGRAPTDRLDNLESLVENSFPSLEDTEKCSAIELLGYVSCAVDNTLEVQAGDDHLTSKLSCCYCQNSNPGSEVTKCIDFAAAKTAITNVFNRLLGLQSFTESRRSRVTAMVVLRRLVRHSTDPSFLDLQVSPAGLWCLKSLHSSSARELRIAAGRTLPSFLTSTNASTTSVEVIQSNCEFALSALHSISNQNLPHLAESCIMAWSQVGRVVSDDRLNLVLVKLVEYLGHKSTIVPVAAFNEISTLAQSRRITTKRLFEPYWRFLAFSAVKDYASQPKTTRLLAELLEMTVPDLLLLVQSHALPYLVLTKRVDVIQKIADVRGESEPWQPCLDVNNVGPIMALLLIQDAENIPENAMKMLRHISGHFDGLSFVDLLKTEPVMTSLALLKTAGDADEQRKPHIRNALELMATLMQPAAREPSKKKKRELIGRFLEENVLGLMARLTDVFNEASLYRSASSTVDEQRRCIKAMEELIRIGRSWIRIARPQISACVLSAMSHDDLRAPSFSCWSAMVRNLEEDLEVLLETTFFIIHHYWDTFDAATQQCGRELVEFLLDKHSKLLESYISKLPDFTSLNGLSELERRLGGLRQPVDNRTALQLLAERVQHENSGVVLQALRELATFLEKQQGYIQSSVVSEQPDSVVSILARALLDCASKYAGEQNEISQLCTQSLGFMGCLDPNRIETVRAERSLVVLSNFSQSGETTDFALRLIEDVLVKSFLAATDTRFQGLLSYVMQELLERCDIASSIKMQTSREGDRIYRKFIALSEETREVISPFLTSRYRLGPMVQQPIEYPVFRPGRMYANWVRNLTLDLLRRPQNPFAELIFEPLCRVIRVKDISAAEFLFPYLVLHVIVGEESGEEVRNNVLRELLNVLQHEVANSATFVEREDKKLYYEAVFRVIDYAMRWLQCMRSQQQQDSKDLAAMEKVQKVLDSIPAELVSQRAVDCKAYSRALFYLEQHIRQVEGTDKGARDKPRLLQRLQDIYTQIDEPDGLEGISAHLQVLDINQQILSHRKAGRWAAAQTWYEIKLAENPEDADVQIELLTCLKESGQHDVLLNYVEGIENHAAAPTINRIVPYAVEASWATARWQTMQKFISRYQGDRTENFNLCIAQILLHLQNENRNAFIKDVKALRDRIGSSMTYAATASLNASHEAMLKCHVLTDIELIANLSNTIEAQPQETLKTLNRRLEVVGSYVNDKQYILGIRRAAMQLMQARYSDLDISSLWLASARLARKANSMHQSFNAVLHASQLGDDSATIENARLLWKQGHNRKAIQTLRGAISNNVFLNRGSFSEADSSERNAESQQNMLIARAHLLLAKWLDSTGQTNVSALRQQYQNVPKNYGTWEKGHYYLGRHYKKILESEKALKPDDQSDEYLTGETAKLVIENYIRSLNYGTKYLYQTLPRILTLWLELGAQVDKAPEGKVSISRELHYRRRTQLQSLHTYLYKYIQRMPAYIFYTALPQLVARIAHPNNDVFKLLESIIVKVVSAHPKQALWSLFAILSSKQATSERKARGQLIVQKLRGMSQKVEGGSFELRTLLRMGEKLADQLLMACNNGDFQSNRTTHASITRDLNFNHKCTPCPLVVPIETCLTATLPTLTDNVKKHQAFSRDVITIESFLDDVLVLGSLAKPRKLTARGSNGQAYGLLIKPKDDLRTDQRLMEFNGLINRSLKRDAESSRRQLYIRTYAVTPLNEECGIIEWVDGLRTLRDILLLIYRNRGVAPNYGHLAQMMKDAVSGEKNIKLFTEGVLGQFPAVLPHWFISQFPNPSAWFAARLKYTRSCAVMSMVGTILGLGDRHGENILLEEGNGGVFHVDFNCLFDKGLTFALPERVPFRLTHNMVAAMGIYGYEGPFRQCSELTLRILRQQEETLMTILEAFIYDPTLDLQRDKKRKHDTIKLNPHSVVDSIRRKVRGLPQKESIPLGVEGQVDELIKQAVNPRNLASMYIGWCPFL